MLIEEIINYLNPKDIAVMRIIEGLRTAFKYVPVSKIKDRLGYKNKNLLEEALNKLNKLELIEHKYMKEEDAYRLRSMAYEVLAFWDLKKQGVIKKILRIVGIGKEAKVYLTLSYNEEPLIAKVHLYSGQEFIHIKRSFAFLSVKWRAKQLNKFDFEIDIPRAKAQIEAIVLNKLKDYNVPEFITLNRNIVVMEMIGEKEPAQPLQKIKIADKESARLLKEDILEHYTKIYEKEGIIHGDLSPSNILFSDTFYIIDWPQAIPKESEFSKEIFDRDIGNIENYFKRKYKI